MEKFILTFLFSISTLSFFGQTQVPTTDTNSPIWYKDGKVGIGTGATTVPVTKLHIYNAQTLGAVAGNYINISRFENYGNTNLFKINDFLLREAAGSDWLTVSFVRGISVDASFGDPATLKSWIKQYPNVNRIDFGSAGSTYLSINSGNVGIGSVAPRYKLDVNGTIRAKEVKVEAAPWPDYVFEEDYQLKDLDKVESFIKTYKHLPELPSAKELEENGVNLAEMNRLLLKKIEELTLYVIELEGKNEKQQEQFNYLKSEIEALKIIINK